MNFLLCDRVTGMVRTISCHPTTFNYKPIILKLVLEAIVSQGSRTKFWYTKISHGYLNRYMEGVAQKLNGCSELQGKIFSLRHIACGDNTILKPFSICPIIYSCLFKIVEVVHDF